MLEIVNALREQQVELAAIVAGADDAALSRPSRCAGWTVADVLLHLAQTNEMAVASLEQRLGEYIEPLAARLTAGESVDDWAGAVVDQERGDTTDARDRYLRSAADLLDAFALIDPSTRVQWVAGELAARTLASTRLSETWIHTLDVAVAFGPLPEPTARLRHIARLAWRTLPYAFARAGRTLHGPVAFELTGPDDTVWSFGTDDEPLTVIRGAAFDLCNVAGQRAVGSDTDLAGTGPDADAVLSLVRTFA